MIAREGYIPVAAAVVAALVTGYWAGEQWSAPLWVLAAGLVFVFRFPRREVPPEPLGIISPVDGKVAAVRAVHDPWLNRPALRFVLCMRAPGISPLRSPTEGKVMDFWARGRGRRAEGDWFERLNPWSCYVLWVRTDEGDDVVFAVSSMWPLSRFRIDVAPGERVGQGQRNGFVYFGTRVDVLLPESAVAKVRAGDRTLAGSGMLATLVH